MLSPVRGSEVEGGCGASSAGVKLLNAAAFWPRLRARESCTRRWANRRWNTIGASLVVSEPSEMPDSICPVAILAAMPRAPARLVPQACIMVMAGRGGRERAADHRLAGEVPVLGVGDDRAADHFVDMRAVQGEAIDQTAERGGEHVEIGELGISGMRAAKGDARSAKHRNAPHRSFRHDDSRGLPLLLGRSFCRGCLVLCPPIMQRAAAERREARAEDHAGIDMIGAGHHMVG